MTGRSLQRLKSKHIQERVNRKSYKLWWSNQKNHPAARPPGPLPTTQGMEGVLRTRRYEGVGVERRALSLSICCLEREGVCPYRRAGPPPLRNAVLTVKCVHKMGYQSIGERLHTKSLG
jgi:hypothetical protein